MNDNDQEIKVPVDPQTEEDEILDRIIKISNGETPVDEED